MEAIEYADLNEGQKEFLKKLDVLKGKEQCLANSDGGSSCFNIGWGSGEIPKISGV